MATTRLDDQEFVAHLYAPLDGPGVEAALAQIEQLWDACRTQLAMTHPIDGTDLPPALPGDPRATREGALAGLQDQAVNFQAVLRREHDVLNFSLVMAAPLAPSRRRMRLGAATPPGWYEYARWWRTLTRAGVGALLGAATVYQAKTPHPDRADVRSALPSQDDDASQWWTRPTTVDDFTLWEVTPGGEGVSRRLVVLGRPDEDARLSRFTWSAGDVALPPLGRYLLHAAKLRYAARVRGNGAQVAAVRDRTAARLDRITDLLEGPDGADGLAAEAAGLAADQATVAATVQALSWMQRSVEIARDNLGSAIKDPLPADRALAPALAQWLDDDVYFLRQVQTRAEQTRHLIPAPAPQPPARSVLERPAPVAAPARAPGGRTEQRMGFGVDVVRYSDRTTPRQFEIQRRLAGIVERVLSGVGVALHDSDRQDAGDGMMVVLPAGVQPHEALPRLLNGWRAQVTADNAEHPEERIRLRLSVTTGPFTPSDIGFTGATIIETGRLLDSDALRRAVTDHPGADLVALVSDRLHADVVAEGYPGLDAAHFTPVRVRVKTLDKQAWLWTGAPPAEPRPEKAEETTTAPGTRDVFVIHGDDDRARSALFGFLRAIGLRPLEWEQLVARTGSAAPERMKVLQQAFAEHTAAVVLFAPGASPDVLAGMAVALQPDRTILVRLGPATLPGDLAGRDSVHIHGAGVLGLHQLAERLRRLGYEVRTDGTDWLDLTRFT
ncbi:CATRA conflict system CASPASE/TPR repeat-associated protein [Symbioplanes lichenis]|uniref:CATRA conflict system CASPASE/TPR repeat-associated protein n=1 Tax=Symbioplanes lichenis TaxID=1629072 RepID=UPI002738E826|nr:CATRA conflict system CASPASE/TPR repeat-associated protein [Actinoplanes lichenis]